MKMKRLGLVAVVSLGLVFHSCSESSDNGFSGNEVYPPVVTARLAAFEGEGQSVEGENEVDDMQACLFEDGVMTKVYKNLELSGGEYDLRLDRYKGNLYMLANTAGAIDLDRLKESGISESEWLKTVFAPGGDVTTHFFTGVLAIAPQSRASVAQTVSLRRGVARFDLVIDVAGSVAVNKFSLNGVARSAYLFPQEDGAKSPADVVRTDETVTFADALTQSRPAVLYVYEQESAGMEVTVEASFDGQPARTLTKTLPTQLKRNTIYTVTVRKNDIDITVKPKFEDWEQGADTELTPSGLHKIEASLKHWEQGADTEFVSARSR